MGKRLTENITSRYIQAANNLRAKTARKRIVAYVESYDDVSFWSHILSRFDNETTYFQVLLPSSENLVRGKSKAIMSSFGRSLGSHMIACVDSDYDYLLQGTTNISKVLCESPYILHTYAYAIENYECFADSLHNVCVQATLNDHRFIDFTAYMKLFSQIIHPLFVWNIWFYRRGDTYSFSIQDFNNIVRITSFSVNTPSTSLEELASRVSRKLEWLDKHYPGHQEDIQKLAKNLRRLGVEPENTYLFIQGHHLKDQVVLKILIPICSRLRREREEEINQQAKHNEQRTNELSSYRHSGEAVELILRKNTDFLKAPTYKYIEKEIKQLMKLHDQDLSSAAEEEKESINDSIKIDQDNEPNT